MTCPTERKALGLCVEVQEHNWKMPVRVLMPRTELPGKRKRFMDAVKEDMAVVEVTEMKHSTVATPDGRSRKKK